MGTLGPDCPHSRPRWPRAGPRGPLSKKLYGRRVLRSSLLVWPEVPRAFGPHARLKLARADAEARRRCVLLASAIGGGHSRHCQRPTRRAPRQLLASSRRPGCATACVIGCRGVRSAQLVGARGSWSSARHGWLASILSLTWPRSKSRITSQCRPTNGAPPLGLPRTTWSVDRDRRMMRTTAHHRPTGRAARG